MVGLAGRQAGLASSVKICRAIKLKLGYIYTKFTIKSTAAIFAYDLIKYVYHQRLMRAKKEENEEEEVAGRRRRITLMMTSPLLL